MTSTLAAIVLLLCLVLLGRLLMKPQQRDLLDQRARRLGQDVLRKLRGLRGLGARRESRRQAAKAGQEARQAIERARSDTAGVDRQGNVYRPRSFERKPGADRKDH
jgi:hypothetical protein